MPAHSTEEMLMLSLLLVLPFSLTSAVSAGCECVVFDTTFQKEFGLFTSPNWPVPYEDNIDCLLYTFVGADEQMVEISFDEFDLQRTNLECVFGDYVKLFLHLEDSSVNERSSYNSILCGKIMDIEQTHYSSGHTLVFEFHTDWRRTNSTGFSGTYRFLKVFQTDGYLLPGSKCNYEISPEQTNRTRGKFYSPQYPSNYPRDVTCHYRFAATPNNRVKILFEQIRLQKGDLSCLNSPDVILVYDGSNKSSPIIGHLCNTNTFVELVSTGPELFVEFHSRSHFPGQGFKAAYAFDSSATQRINDIDVPYMESIRRTTDYLTTTLEPAEEGPCGGDFSSALSREGVFSSPNYPDPYPGEVSCLYSFRGRGKERVQILFTDFDLHMPHETPRDCEGVDAVMVFISIRGQKERVENFCGQKLPQQLMSNGPNMQVEFRALHRQDPLGPEAKGFRALYRFVTDFGMTGAKQDASSVCGFVFRSEEGANGSFSSPNFPGLYPRATECHYFFRGRPGERVHIAFTHFNVDGIPPCTTETASDYVEFSNYRTVDRKIPRHCGVKRPQLIESDGDFFRVTFKSNDKFDGTGFHAHYHFRPHIDPATVKRVSSTNSKNIAGRISSSIEQLISTILFHLGFFSFL
ncbi:suppressor of lurcher protein 1-like [Uloborus diversus]|uniref:suppressor of lurcher protein 1-like n=1 Tax=Uloborus diversus TaxID=327109 RepID=UPI0024090DA1|nr:suppressor of lurcher protein 1-like [Uloborus diversus]